MRARVRRFSFTPSPVQRYEITPSLTHIRILMYGHMVPWVLDLQLIRGRARAALPPADPVMQYGVDRNRARGRRQR